jgi:adenylate cyclase
VTQFDPAPSVHFLSGVGMADEPPLEIVVPLHARSLTAILARTNRLDFTVIGPAVNLVSRIEGVAKAFDRPILVSSDFQRALGDGVVLLGLHDLRGLATSQELFAPV